MNLSKSRSKAHRSQTRPTHWQKTGQSSTRTFTKELGPQFTWLWVSWSSWLQVNFTACCSSFSSMWWILPNWIQLKGTRKSNKTSRSQSISTGTFLWQSITTLWGTSSRTKFRFWENGTRRLEHFWPITVSFVSCWWWLDFWRSYSV